MRADALIVEDICAYGVAQLNTFAGENQLDDTTEKFTNNSTTIEMAAAYWNASAIATLMRVGAVNRFTNPMALSGSLLHEAALNASWDGGNADGKGGIRRFTDFPIRFDELNVDTDEEGYINGEHTVIEDQPPAPSNNGHDLVDVAIAEGGEVVE